MKLSKVVRLQPNTYQEQMFRQFAGTNRFAWNQSKAFYDKMWNDNKEYASVQEQNLYKFRQIIAYKGKKNGIRVLLADRWHPSSKMCSCCGNVKTDLKLSDRTYHCDICGFTMDRDENAAINIENCNKFKKIKVA